ncbi:glycosyltransferase family 4 protein [Pedobacter sp.]|uniref:glycosyltransferase family 4 protein n=1 Tax=Pedobacter sp. TaxID=1411316 RepID=UPI003D7FBC51
MRILFIAARFHTNQISLVNKLLQEGHQIDFFVMGQGNSEDYSALVPKIIPISVLTKAYIRLFKKSVDISAFQKYALPEPVSYYKMINAFKPDVLIIRGGPEPVYSWLLYPYLWSKIKLIYYTQNPIQVQRVSLLRKIYDYVLSNRYRIKWFSPVLYTGNQGDQTLSLSYMDYLPFFISPRPIRPDLESKLQTIKLLCVAKYEPRKNLRLLLDVTAHLSKNYPNFKLTIIGSTGTAKREDYYEQLKADIESRQLQNIISLIKNVPNKEMDSHYQQHHVFLMPSIREPASVSQLEAMASGLAIICSRDNGTAHYVADHKNGFLINAAYHDLYQAIEKYLLQPAIIQEHRQHSLYLVNTAFNIDNNYKKLMDIIESAR